MTTITIFLPTAILNQPISDLIAAEKTLVLDNAIAQKLSRNYRMKILPFVILCFTTAAFADDFKLVRGKDFEKVESYVAHAKSSG